MAQLDRGRLSGGIVLALTAACSTSAVHSGTTGGGGKGGATGQGGGATSTTVTTSSTVSTGPTSTVATGVGGSAFGGAGGMGGMAGLGGAASTGGAGQGGSMAAACDPSSIWAQGALTYPSYDTVTLCPYVGDVLLVVNTAAI